VFVVFDWARLIDQQHRDAVGDGVRPPEPGVVENIFVLHVQEGTLVFGAGQYVEESLIERHAWSVLTHGHRLSGEQGRYLGDVGGDLFVGGGLEVES
jgi:hypothetical protein